LETDLQYIVVEIFRAENQQSTSFQRRYLRFAVEHDRWTMFQFYFILSSHLKENTAILRFEEHSLRNIINLRRPSCKFRSIFSRFQMKLECIDKFW